MDNAEMRARFNPEGSVLRRLQMNSLKVLKYIDRICRENNITYWLSSGTCLGAVRHGGFIPWDDDVDVEMLEKDFRKFVAILGHEPKDGYVLQSAKNEPTYIAPFAKVRDFKTYVKENQGYDKHYKYNGAFVDVFPLVPSRMRHFHKQAFRMRMRAVNYDLDPAKARECRLWHWRNQLVFPIFRLLDSAFPGKRLRHKLGSCFYSPRYLDELFPVKYVAFEGVMLPVPNNVDAYLTRIYGDYMTLPDLSNIETHFKEIKFLD